MKTRLIIVTLSSNVRVKYSNIHYIIISWHSIFYAWPNLWRWLRCVIRNAAYWAI